MRFFQQDAYITMDMLEKKCEIIRMKDAPENPDEFALVFTDAKNRKKQVYFENPPIEENNAIKDELESFADAIQSDRTPDVPLLQGTEALRVAMMVMENSGSY